MNFQGYFFSFADTKIKDRTRTEEVTNIRLSFYWFGFFDYSGYFLPSGIHRQNKHMTITGNTQKYSFLIISVAQSSSYNRYKSKSPYLIDTNVNTITYINR